MFITREKDGAKWPDIEVDPIVKWVVRAKSSGFYESTNAVVQYNYMDDFGNILWKEGDIIDLTEDECIQAEASFIEYDKEYFNSEVRASL